MLIRRQGDLTSSYEGGGSVPPHSEGDMSDLTVREDESLSRARRSGDAEWGMPESGVEKAVVLFA